MLFYIITILLVVLDQVTKLIAINHLLPVGSIELIEGIFSLTYVENRGAAFGILQDARWVFISATTLAIIALIIWKTKSGPRGKIINTALCLILSGAVGNMIDRVFRGFVVDMLHVTFIDYPVFNVADCFVVVGTILLAVYILFIYQEPKKDDENDKV